MTDDMTEIRRDLGTIRETVGRIAGRQEALTAELGRLSGRIETIFGCLTSGQGEQDDRITQLAIEQGRQGGVATHRQVWQSWLIPGGVAGIISLLSHLLPGVHHP